MELPDGRYTFLLFIAIIQILYGTMDTSVDCLLRDHPHYPGGTKPPMLPPIGIPSPIQPPGIPPIGIPGNINGATRSKNGPEGIIRAPCPSGTQANGDGNCRQRLD